MLQPYISIICISHCHIGMFVPRCVWIHFARRDTCPVGVGWSFAGPVRRFLQGGGEGPLWKRARDCDPGGSCQYLLT